MAGVAETAGMQFKTIFAEARHDRDALAPSPAALLKARLPQHKADD